MTVLRLLGLLALVVTACTAPPSPSQGGPGQDAYQPQTPIRTKGAGPPWEGGRQREVAVPLVPASGPALQPVGYQLGVHTRVTDEVEAWKIARTMQMVREMGAQWVVEYFPWAYSQPDRDRYDWDHADLVVEEARRNGLRLIARVDMVPDWARPPGSTNRFLEEASYSLYADFVAAFAQRYRGTIQHIVIWNEPNVSFEWGFRPVDPDSYARLLATTYSQVKAVAPETQVLFAGLAPTLEQSDQALPDVVFLDRAYQAGAGRSFDALAVHAYGWRSPPDEPPAPEAINFRRLELLRQVMVDHGDADKPIFVTESGWNDHPRWTKAVRPGQRIEYTLRALELARQWPWLAAINLWTFRLPRDAHNYNDYFTLVSVDFHPRPIYDAIRAYVQAG